MYRSPRLTQGFTVRYLSMNSFLSLNLSIGCEIEKIIKQYPNGTEICSLFTPCHAYAGLTWLRVNGVMIYGMLNCTAVKRPSYRRPFIRVPGHTLFVCYSLTRVPARTVVHTAQM